MRRPLSRIPDDRGSALMLVPAGVLVLLVLGAIAIDSAVVALAQRELSDRTAEVANDIAGAGASDDSFYQRGEVTLSPDVAASYTARSFGVAPSEPFVAWSASARTLGRTVEVTAAGDVHYVFLKAIPGFPDTITVRARSIATARGG